MGQLLLSINLPDQPETKEETHSLVHGCGAESFIMIAKNPK